MRILGAEQRPLASRWQAEESSPTVNIPEAPLTRCFFFWQFFIDDTMPKIDTGNEKPKIRAIDRIEPATFPNTGYEDKTGIMVQLGDAAYLSEVN